MRFCLPTVNLFNTPKISTLINKISIYIAILCLLLSSFPSSADRVLSCAWQSLDLNSATPRKSKWLYFESLNQNLSPQVKYFLFHFSPEQSKRWYKHDHNCHSQDDFIPVECSKTKRKILQSLQLMSILQ